MSYEDKIHKILKLHEDVKLKPYRDTVGKLTIGVGRNLDDVGISTEEADFLLMGDISNVEDDLKSNLTFFSKLDEVRQVVLVDMCFNMGIKRLLNFKNTLALIAKGDYGAAADQMLKSVWASQVKLRAKRLSEMMRTGKYPDELA